MFSLCYAQHPGYLLHIVFPFPSILQHYVEFNTCTITMLEKLPGVRSFDGSINHLAHHQVIFLVFWVGLASFLSFGLLSLHSWDVGH